MGGMFFYPAADVPLFFFAPLYSAVRAFPALSAPCGGRAVRGRSLRASAYMVSAVCGEGRARNITIVLIWPLYSISRTVGARRPFSRLLRLRRTVCPPIMKFFGAEAVAE